MKKFKNIFFSIVFIFSIASCDDQYKNYPEGYDREYYAFFNYEYDVSNNPSLQNTTLNKVKTDSVLIPLSVKFASEYNRDFDVDVRLYIRQSSYFLTQIGVTKPPLNQYSTPDSLALPGVDFDVVDSLGQVITPIQQDSLLYYNITFPNAQKGVNKVYVKLLNNKSVSHIRTVWFSLALHKILTTTTEADYRRTNLNNVQNDYLVRTTSNSYMRRLNIR